MTRVFLDTNILIDYYLNRSGAVTAEKILKCAVARKITLYASTLTFANFAYVVKKDHTREEMYMILDRVENLVHALPMDRRQLRRAIDNPCKDFEDMLQYQCAISGNCGVIVTNNKKDFRDFCQLPLLTAQEYIDTLKK